MIVTRREYIIIFSFHFCAFISGSFEFLTFLFLSHQAPISPSAHKKERDRAMQVEFRCINLFSQKFNSPVEPLRCSLRQRGNTACRLQRHILRATQSSLPGKELPSVPAYSRVFYLYLGVFLRGWLELGGLGRDR
jgi:hypothetical protein